MKLQRFLNIGCALADDGGPVLEPTFDYVNISDTVETPHGKRLLFEPSGYIDTKTKHDFIIQTGVFTIAAKINRHSNTGSTPIIRGLGMSVGGVTGHMLSLSYNGDVVFSIISRFQTVLSHTWIVRISNNVDVSYVIVGDGVNVSLYLDGVFIDAQPMNISKLGGTQGEPTTISSVSPPFGGTIGDVVIDKRGWSAQEVLEYHAGTTFKYMENKVVGNYFGGAEILEEVTPDVAAKLVKNVRSNSVSGLGLTTTQLLELGHLHNSEISASDVGLDGFISVWDVPEDHLTITIPRSGAGYDTPVEWYDDDGVLISTTIGTDADPSAFTKTFQSAGVYTCRITGAFPWIYTNAGAEKDYLIRVTNLGRVGWTNMDDAFYGCSNLVEFTVGNADTSNVVSCSNMLRECDNANMQIDMRGFNTSSVTSMYYMFASNSNWPSAPDVSGFNTAKVTNMSYMFYSNSDWPSAPDVSGFNTAKVTNMLYMFFNNSNWPSAPDVSGFDTAWVTNMAHMLGNLDAMRSLDISSWDLTALTNLTNFMQSATGLDTAGIGGYDAFLAHLRSEHEAGRLDSGLAIDMGGSKYTNTVDRAYLTTTATMSIVDGGVV